ncbi:MAG TPA: hypothetical protein QF641_04640 [Candidatus Thalassarchaeaceae archaeon]|nr:hypothetical protein [Candidatus Thalassarchaeaceae archaeon]|tara:strand:- start:6645 stop:8651 length:2007 start_codon:yes stop_codon:yes gene_type:complete
MMVGTRVPSREIVAALMMLIVALPISVDAGESSSCCPDQSFDLFIIGDPDSGVLTPFDSDLEEEKSTEVTSSIFGEVEVGTWGLTWGTDGEYSAGSWIFSIPYEVKDASGVSGNATVLVKIGGSTYESSSQIPAFYLTSTGELQVEVEVQEGQISKGDIVEITFSVRSVIFSNPGGESGVRFFWGSPEYDAALSMSFPLVDVEMREASVKGDLIFFPVRLSSGFGEKMWTSSSGGFQVQSLLVSESPISTENEDWVDVTFVWNAESFAGGTLRTDFFLSPQNSLRVEVDKTHDITAGQDSGDNSWYPEEEPPRTGGSNLEVIVDCKYDGKSMDRDTTIRFDGAMSQWMRWGLDNIGNKSLGSNSWWKNLNSYSDSVLNSDKQNGRVDESEESALRNHLRGSKADLKSFLSNGLFVDPESIFGVDPVEFGPIDITFDFGGSRSFNSDVISIRVSAGYDVDEDSRQTLIEDFIRTGGFDYWDSAGLTLEIRTGMLSGLGGVYSDNDEISYNHRRWIVMEILTIEESEIETDTDFRIEFSTSNSLLFSPLVSAMFAVFLLCMAIGFGMALTRKRSRIPSMSMIGVFGVLTFAIYWFGLPMQIVLGIVSSSVLLVFPAALISPITDSDYNEGRGVSLGRVKCPSCSNKIPVDSNVRPLRIECSDCGSTLRLE